MSLCGFSGVLGGITIIRGLVGRISRASRRGGVGRVRLVADWRGWGGLGVGWGLGGAGVVWIGRGWGGGLRSCRLSFFFSVVDDY